MERSSSSFDDVFMLQVALVSRINGNIIAVCLTLILADAAVVDACNGG